MSAPLIHKGRRKSNVSIKFSSLPLDYRRAKEEFLSCYLSAALHAFDNNISRTARTLRVSRRTLQLHINKYGLIPDGLSDQSASALPPRE